MTNISYTENKAQQYKSSNNKCLDWFAQIGALRHQSINGGQDIVWNLFNEAFKEDQETALKVLFWGRWCRGGAGERATFHIIFDRLCRIHPEFVFKNIKAVVKYGYWKELIPYMDYMTYPNIAEQIERLWAIAIMEKDRLACKWAPRKGDYAKAIKGRMNFTWKEYRKHLKEHSETVEQNMASKEWDKINYSMVPSLAMMKYRKAFKKRDTDRFDVFVQDKDTKINVSVLYPHQVFASMVDNVALADKQWKQLPDYVAEGENILPMSDVSGSMTMYGPPEPILVSIGLGLYLSERNKGAFKNKILTFSGSPEFFEVNPDWNIREKYQRVLHANWDMNTNFEKAYRLILDTGTAFNVPQDNMPTMLLVLSDMQFDEATGRNKPHLEIIREEFELAGYTMPKIVFWNLRAGSNGLPATSDDDGVAMVSGYSPALMTALLSAQNFNPVDVMMEAIDPIELNFPDYKI
jgi:hypothetical protein